MHVSVWWVRQDLRLEDNHALTAAGEGGGQVVPLFILDPNLMEKPGISPLRTRFLVAGLHALDGSLRSCGSRLILRRGEPVQVFAALAAELRPRFEKVGVFFEEGHSPYARRRDGRISPESGLEVGSFPGLTFLHPNETLKPDGGSYTTYTPFRRVWRTKAGSRRAVPLPAPAYIRTPADIAGDALPPFARESGDFPAGEDEARRRLERFTAGSPAPIYTYAAERDRLDRDLTSHLSPYLRFGMLSACQAVQAASEALESAPSGAAARGPQVWLDELVWREFYQALLYHHPAVLEGSLRPAYRRIAWRNDPEDFAAWCAGRSGYPLVDAAMRQLLACGWMHNRARMIVASFLVKDLLVDWRWGERWFMQHLIDGDPAANNGGWQWCAGTGSDAAPYFRIFNPVIQSKKFDPQGIYIRRWVEELGKVPDDYIHEPWRMPADVQRSSGCRISGGRSEGDYPAPIVEHALARQRCLAVYRAALSASD